MKFNICVIKPRQYPHSGAFLELSQLLHYSLVELGHASRISDNYLDTGAINIVLGCHLLSLDLLSQVPLSSIILNTEQLEFDQRGWNSKIYSWASKFEVWDYSQKNIKIFQSLGIKNVKNIKIGYQKELRRLNPSREKDIDVLFYGSINERRRVLLESLSKSGLKVKILTNTYGYERDEFIEKSKVVLNLHYYNSHIFEIIRVFYLLSNSIAVISEVNDTTHIEPRILSGLYSSNYDGLVSACNKLVQDEVLRSEIQDSSFEAMKQSPQSVFTYECIESWVDRVM